MEFSNGVKAMARNVIPAIQLVHKGAWTLGDMEDWLNAVINETEENPELSHSLKIKPIVPITYDPCH